MAVTLPNGVVLAIASTYAAATVAATVVSNASECVVTVTNTLAIGDYVEFTSGWAAANNRVFRIKAASGTAVTLEGFDTSSTTIYPAGSGLGTLKKILTWTQIAQIIGATSSGGDPQYLTYSFLEQNFDTQIPTTTSAQTLSLEIADDPSLAGYQAVRTAALARTNFALRGTLPGGGFLLYNGIWAFDETPSMSKGNLMAVKAGVALQGRPVRYTT